jgi:N-acetylglucosamine-6-sulfatase
MSRPTPVHRTRAVRRRSWRTALSAAIAATLVVGLASCTSAAHHPNASAPTVSPPTPTRPNIVFVLTDDLAPNLLKYMPHVEALQRSGMSFSNYTVTDSACCPSRASILTGGFPHTTKIFRNQGPDGGYLVFHKRGEEADTFGAMVHKVGYRTAFMGKYLNRYYASYPAPKFLSTWTPPEVTHVPQGWDEWDAVGLGYSQYNYDLNHDHTVIHHGAAPKDYLNTVLQGYAQSFIDSSAAKKQPFLLEVSSFSPHFPTTPAPQDVNTFPTVTAPRSPAFDTLPKNAPYWLAARAPLDTRAETVLDNEFRRRVEAVQSVDRMVGALESKLAATGQAANTVFVFSSDNGYHMGEYRLHAGKFTAFDTDIKVPLIVSGPGIPAGTINSDVTENIDLAPTFEELTGASLGSEVDGKSLVPLLHGQHPQWRSLALIEHHGPNTTPGDPDAQTWASGNPPAYEAIRSKTFTYVRYENGAREYYNRVADPYELDNIAPDLSVTQVEVLDRMLDTLKACRGAAQCWSAAHPGNV